MFKEGIYCRQFGRQLSTIIVDIFGICRASASIDHLNTINRLDMTKCNRLMKDTLFSTFCDSICNSK